jgi:hypothetical protein
MTAPVEVDIPHSLGKVEVRRRIDGGIGRLADMIPGGAVTAQAWSGDTLDFTVEGFGQRLNSRLEVFEDKVHAVVDLPPFLALFAEKIRAKLAKEGPKMLE